MTIRLNTPGMNRQMKDMQQEVESMGQHHHHHTVTKRKSTVPGTSTHPIDLCHFSDSMFGNGFAMYHLT